MLSVMSPNNSSVIRVDKLTDLMLVGSVCDDHVVDDVEHQVSRVLRSFTVPVRMHHVSARVQQLNRNFMENTVDFFRQKNIKQETQLSLG